MRRVSFILMLVLITSFQVGCGGKKSAGKSLPEAKYIKVSTKSIMLVQVDKLYGSELGKLIPASAMEGNPLGLSEKDVERAVVGMSSVSAQGPPAAVGVLTLKSSADKAAIKKSIESGEAKEANGQKYYILMPGTAVHFDESAGVVVVGPEESVKEALSDAKSSDLMDKVSANLGQHIYAYFDVASAKSAIDEVSSGPGAAGPMAMVMGMIQPLMTTKSVELMVDLTGSELLHIHLDAGDPENATKTNNTLQGLLVMAKGGVSQQAEKAPAPMKAGMDLAKEAVESITVEARDSIVEIAVPRPKDFVSRVKGLLPPQQ